MNSTLRDALGRYVRAAWITWARTQPDPKPSWLVPYDELPEHLKEADRCIGEAVWTAKNVMDTIARMSPFLAKVMIAGATPNSILTANHLKEVDSLSVRWLYSFGSEMPSLVHDTWKPDVIKAAIRIASAGYAKFDHDRQCLVMLRKISVNEFQSHAGDFALVPLSPVDKAGGYSMEICAASAAEQDTLGRIERWSQNIPGVDVKIFDKVDSNTVRLAIAPKPSVN